MNPHWFVLKNNTFPLYSLTQAVVANPHMSQMLFWMLYKAGYTKLSKMTCTQCLAFCLLIIPWSIWLVSDIEILQHPVNKEPLCFFPNRTGPVTPDTESTLVSLVSFCSDTVPAGPYSPRTIAARCHQDHQPAQLQASIKCQGLKPSWRMA